MRPSRGCVIPRTTLGFTWKYTRSCRLNGPRKQRKISSLWQLMYWSWNVTRTGLWDTGDRTGLPCPVFGVWINQPWTVKIYIVDMFILFLFNFPNNKMILRIFITFLNQQFTTEIQRNNWPMETGGCLEPGYCVWVSGVCWWKLTKSGLTIIAAQPWPSPESWNNFPSGCWSQWIYQQNIHQSEIRPPNLKNTSPSSQCW